MIEEPPKTGSAPLPILVGKNESADVKNARVKRRVGMPTDVGCAGLLALLVAAVALGKWGTLPATVFFTIFLLCQFTELGLCIGSWRDPRSRRDLLGVCAFLAVCLLFAWKPLLKHWRGKPLPHAPLKGYSVAP